MRGEEMPSSGSVRSGTLRRIHRGQQERKRDGWQALTGGCGLKGARTAECRSAACFLLTPAGEAAIGRQLSVCRPTDAVTSAKGDSVTFPRPQAAHTAGAI